MGILIFLNLLILLPDQRATFLNIVRWRGTPASLPTLPMMSITMTRTRPIINWGTSESNPDLSMPKIMHTNEGQSKINMASSQLEQG